MRLPLSKSVFLFAALALVGISCSGKVKRGVYPATGMVYVKDKPAAGVVLTFFAVPGDPSAIPPIAKSDEDGKFSIVTEDQEGAPPGDYVVTATWMEHKEAAPAKKGEAISMSMVGDSSDKLGGKYQDRKKSGIKVTIKKGPNELEPIKLK
jgi:hypothetical protein